MQKPYHIRLNDAELVALRNLVNLARWLALKAIQEGTIEAAQAERYRARITEAEHWTARFDALLEAEDRRRQEALRREIRETFDWPGLVKEVQNAEIRETLDGQRVQEVYLGSVFSMLPSGKYYTAFASSNVTEEEADADAAYYEALDDVAAEYGLYIASGEGNPNDLYVGRIVEEAIKEEGV